MNLKRFTGDGAPGGDAESTHYVLGGGYLGAAVAQRLASNGVSVTLVDELPAGDHPDLSGVDVVHGDPADTDRLDAIGVSGASTVLVASQSDSRNLLVAQLVRVNFDADVVVLANVPDRYDSIAQAGHEPVCATTALSDALVENA